jgi:membrane protein YqaA with SNARE-associated domain
MAVAAAFSSGSLLPTTPGTHLAPFTLRFPFRLHPRCAALVAAAATLREVCAGRVPDHVLQR